MTIAVNNKFFPFIWFNGEFVSWFDAKIHVLTHSLHYAGAAYEGERAYNGKIFKLKEHTERLINSVKTLHLNLKYSFQDIIDAHQQLIAKNNIEDAYVRPLIWRGDESLGLASNLLSVNMLILAVHSVPRKNSNLKLHISNWQKPHPKAMPIECKSSGNYNMMIIAEKEAQEKGFDDALLLDWRGLVAECTTTNVFFVQNEKIITPVADAFLNGITRQTIIKLARNLGYSVEEKYINPEEIDQFDECFITGTAAEVKGIGSIAINESKQKIFGQSSVTLHLQQEYAKLVRL